MNYKRLEENILRNCTLLTKKRGNELFLSKSVNSIQGKKINDIYHIYGKVNSDNRDNNIHIKYDLNRDKLCGFKCTCSKYKVYLEQGHTYYCEHIAAVAFRFLYSLKAKVNESRGVSKSENNE